MGMAIPEYGVYGDLIHDDWSGLQQWINDGITSGKKLLLPPPPGGGYLVTKPLVFNLPNSFNENLGISMAPLILEGEPGYNGATGSWAINYMGPNGTSALIFNSLQFATIKGITINIGGNGTASNQVAFDVLVSTTLANFDKLHLIDCSVRFQGTGGNHIAFRFGQSPGGTQSNITGVQMNHCSVYGEGGQYSTGSIGCQIGGGEVIPFLAIDCQFSELGAAWVVGSIQSPLVANVADHQNYLPVQNNLLFPASGTAPGTVPGTVVIGSATTVNYTGKDNTSRQISDGVLNGTTTLTSNSANFSSFDVGSFLGATGIPVGTYIQSVTNSTTVTMSQAATTSGGSVEVSITHRWLTGCNAIRSITDGVLNGATTLTSNTANFSSFDVGATLAATGIPVGTTIQSVTNSTTVVMSQAATTTASGVTVSITDNGVPAATAGESVQQSVPNQGVYYGGSDNTWIGCGGGRNHWDFLIQNNGSIRIFGGRWEGNNGVNQVYQGNRFLQASTMPTSDNYNVLIEGVTIDGYNEPTDYPGVFVLNAATTLRLVSCNILASGIPADYIFSSNFINAQGSYQYTSITLEDCNIQAPIPFWTLSPNAGVTAINLRNLQLSPAHPQFTPNNIANMEVLGGTTTTVPTITAGTGAGTLPTISISGLDQAGTITLTTGTSPQPYPAIVCTVTFVNAYPSTPRCVILTPANGAAAALSGNAAVYEDLVSRTASSFTVRVGSTELTANYSNYIWNYEVIG